MPQRIASVAGEIARESDGKFLFETVDPDVENSPITRSTLLASHGLQPIVSMFTPESYYFHLLLQVGEETSVLFPGGDLPDDDLRGEIESALKRAVPGFLQTVGLWHPPVEPISFGGQTVRPLSSWDLVREHLAQTYTVTPVDLTTGRVAGNVGVLVVIAPQGMTDQQRFAIDQFLMRGGAVILASGAYALAPIQFGGSPQVLPVGSGLKEMLSSYGVDVGDALVMDLRNEPFPFQVRREVGGLSVVEIQQTNYPAFVDIRRDSMAPQSPIVGDLPAVTLHWASPLNIDPTLNKGREVVTLLQSSKQSWLRTSADLEPDLEKYPEIGFPIEGEQAPRPLAVSIRGSFDSYFKNRASPFQDGPQFGAEGAAQGSADQETILGTIEVSPETSRLVVIGSSEFVDDVSLSISQSLSPDRYLFNLQLLQNAVDWAVEDEDLLGIPVPRDERPPPQAARRGPAALLGGVELRRRGDGGDSDRRCVAHQKAEGIADAAPRLPARRRGMTRRNAILAGILVVQAVVLAIIFRPTAPPAREAPLFPDLKPNRILSLTISDATGQRAALARGSRGWVLPEADDYPSRRDQVSSLISKLQGLRSDRLVAKTRESHRRLKVAEQGFDRLIEFDLVDGTSRRLYLGTAESFRAAHVRADDDQAVYLALGISTSDAPADISGWVDPVYFSIPENTPISAVTLENKNGIFEFTVAEGGGWTTKGLAADQTVDQNAISSLLGGIASLPMLRPLGNKEAEGYGLQQPSARLAIETGDGDDGSGPLVLRVGAKSEQDGSYVAISSESAYYVKVAESAVRDLVEYALDDFLETPTAPATTTQPVP